MPTISIFFGIVISMYFRDTQRHHLPHIHARYQNFKAVFAIEDGRILDGDFPPSIKPNWFKPGSRFTGKT